jgi:hypothetical protein
VPKQGLQAKLLCLRNALNLRKLSLYFMENKRQWCFSNKFLRPKFGLLHKQIFPTWTLLWMCVINQSIGHYLLLDALIVYVGISLFMEVKLAWLGDRFKILDKFGSKLLFLLKKCNRKVLKAMKTFLWFFKACDPHNVHNNLVVMLDPHIKSLQVVENNVLCERSIHLTFEYDMKTSIPLLIIFLINSIPMPKHVQHQLVHILLNLKEYIYYNIHQIFFKLCISGVFVVGIFLI